MAGCCCCDHWERWNTWTPEDLPIATASLRSQMLRLRHFPSLLYGSMAATIIRRQTWNLLSEELEIKPSGADMTAFLRTHFNECFALKASVEGHKGFPSQDKVKLKMLLMGAALARALLGGP